MKIVFFVCMLLSVKLLYANCPCTLKNERVLEQSDVTALLVMYPQWRVEVVDNHRQFSSFFSSSWLNSARALVPIAVTAEQYQHHPDVILTPDGLTLSIYTHAQKEVTFKDVSLVQAYKRGFNYTKKKVALVFRYDELPCSAEEIASFIAQNNGWQVDNNGSILIFSCVAPDFLAAAHALQRCCLLNNIGTQLQEVRLSYGKCSLTLQSTKNKLISADTIVHAQACHNILKALKK
ncbi:4a-hydroxytetrahydrobiopterin dehydratase [bacterium]|nr:MAG: 4a-hydroxytetrahydrobiopterin dehydratase [bacterium]